jgi:glycine C-acetyltransferase
MSYQDVKGSYAAEIAEIKAAGLWKTERVIASEQKNEITLEDGANVVNMCANNYLGLSE